MRACPGLLTKRGSTKAEQVVTLLTSLGVSKKALAREINALPMLLVRSPSVAAIGPNAGSAHRLPGVYPSHPGRGPRGVRVVEPVVAQQAQQVGQGVAPGGRGVRCAQDGLLAGGRGV